MSDTQNSTPTFHVGITMAGAGSAGCYTGGAMDYLFEILDLWQKAKQKNLPGFEEFYSLIPTHNVVIDAMGGTSAGGMTTCMSAVYALKGEINAVTDPGVAGVKRDNIFYDSWVMLDDDLESEGEKTLFKAFNADDLKENKFMSLLNSKIIDNIADNALHVEGELDKQVAALPPYISKDLDILQVHTMLRGIPLGINFSNSIGDVKGVSKPPTHTSFEHFMVSHYKLNRGIKTVEDGFLWFNPYQKPYSDTISLTTKATGAFPIGLKFRDIDQKTFTDKYLQCVTERTIFNRFREKKKEDHEIDWSNFPVNFNFVTIDGGAINNEPFGEVLGILKSRYNECFENGYPKYGVVMIDPFPDEVDQAKEYKAPDDLFSVIPAIISTLHDQSKVKRADMVEAAENPYFRGVIFPRKWINRKKDEFPITTGSVSAFGGFLDIQFRHYDFFLGRDNSRNYFRYYFSVEYFKDAEYPEKSIIHPIHRSWTQEMIDVFKVTGKDGKTYLPIIPDLNILKEKKSGNIKDPYKYSVEEKPKYDPKQFFLIREQMQKRFLRILEIAKRKTLEKKSKAETIETDKWMNKFYRKTTLGKFGGGFITIVINGVFYFTKKMLAKKITSAATRWVIADLEKKGMLKKYEE